MGRGGAEAGAPDLERERDRPTQGAYFPAAGTGCTRSLTASVEIQWTARELESLAELAWQPRLRPDRGTIRALRD